MKSQSDTERFRRYRSVIDLLRARDRFRSADVYEALKNEKRTFIGKVINELVRDGYPTSKHRCSTCSTK